jgi:hypothetical protein
MAEQNIIYMPIVLNTPAKATFTAGAAGAAVQFRAPAPAGQQNMSAVLMLKAGYTTAGPGAHVLVGDLNVPAPGAGDMLLQEVDGWVRVQVPFWATHVRAFGEGTTVGSVEALLVVPYA